ncbi:unnamed protein product [Boreogadus saida]
MCSFCLKPSHRSFRYCRPQSLFFPPNAGDMFPLGEEPCGRSSSPWGEEPRGRSSHGGGATWKVLPWGRSHVEGPPPLGEEPCVRSPPWGEEPCGRSPLDGGGPWGPTVPPLCPGLFGARMSPGTLRKMDLLRFSFFCQSCGETGGRLAAEQGGPPG